MSGRAMKQVFEMKHTGQETKNRLNHHPFTPGFHPTDFQVAQRFTYFDKPSVAQANGVTVELLRQRTKPLVVNISAVPIPSNDLPSRVHQPTQLDADDPTSVAFAFLTQWLLTTRFTGWVQQLNAITVNHCQQRRTCQEPLTPALLFPQATLQAGSLRQTREQGGKVLLQPTIEAAEIPA